MSLTPKYWNDRATGLVWTCVLLAVLGTGCASSPKNRTTPAPVGTAATARPEIVKAAPNATTPSLQVQQWAGRISLVIDTDPPQPYHGGFELSGRAEQGQLILLSPLGSTVMSMLWSPQGAIWRGGDQEQHYSSLDKLLTLSLGAPIPVRTLFDWLAGIPTPAPGWQLDLTRQPQGRIQVQRLEPLPRIDLRLAVDR